MRNFGMTLSSLRRETGRSQREVAADLGISQALLSHYENNAREPKLDFVVKTCDYYNVTSDYILGRSDERNRNPSVNIGSLSALITELLELKSAEESIVKKLKQLTEHE